MEEIDDFICFRTDNRRLHGNADDGIVCYC